MTTDGISAKVTGLPELRDALSSVVPKLRRRALRNALAAGARLVRDEAVRIRRSTSGSPVVRGTHPNYKRGTVAKAIRVRTSKIARAAGDVGVFVNVRPLPRGEQSRKNPSDPFYWRWLEFGTKFMRRLPFLTPAASKLDQALQRFIAVIGPQIQKLDSNPKDPL